MDTPTSKLLEITIPAYRMQTQMFDNMLIDIKEEDALKRIEARTNHITWMVGNLVNCRYWLASVLSMEDKDPNENLFGEAKALDEHLTYPSLEQLKKEWHKISPKLYKKILSLTDEELNEPFAFGMDVEYIPENKLNMIAMELDRLSYLFGQLGLMRRILDYPGVRYDTNKDLKY